ISKFGSKRLIITGDGTYSGDVNVDEGVLRAENDTALGQSTSGTAASGLESYAQTTTTVGTGVKEVQNLTLTGNNGTFKLSFGGDQTQSLNGFAATAQEVENALDNLPSVLASGGSFTVTKVGNIFAITFGGAYAGIDQPELVATTTGGLVVTQTNVLD